MSFNQDTGSGDPSPRDTRTALDREARSARDQLNNAGEQIREGAESAYAQARDRAAASAEDGKAAVAGSLDDFTAAIKRASDELGERDQSLAANLVRQAAGGLEQASEALKGRSLPELAGSVADFARRQPAAFLIGAALAGVALGRFARASSDHGRGPSFDRRSNDRDGATRYGRDRDDAPRGYDTRRDEDRSGGQRFAQTSRTSPDEQDRRAGTSAGATPTPGSAPTSGMGYPTSVGLGASRATGSAASDTASGGASDAQLNRFGASSSTDTTRLSGSQENDR